MHRHVLMSCAYTLAYDPWITWSVISSRVPVGTLARNVRIWQTTLGPPPARNGNENGTKRWKENSLSFLLSFSSSLLFFFLPRLRKPRLVSFLHLFEFIRRKLRNRVGKTFWRKKKGEEFGMMDHPLLRIENKRNVTFLS